MQYNGFCRNSNLGFTSKILNIPGLSYTKEILKTISGKAAFDLLRKEL